MAETSGSCAYSLSFSGRHSYEKTMMPQKKTQTILDRAQKEFEIRNIIKEEARANRIEAKSPNERTTDEALFLFGYKTKLAMEKKLNKLNNTSYQKHFDIKS